jgi:hypothetical protein
VLRRQGEARAWLTLHRSSGKELGFDLETIKRDVWRNRVSMEQIRVAHEWLKRLVDAGNTWGQFLQGCLLLKGIDGVQESDEAEGIALVTRAAEGGLAAAQNALGLLHAKGEQGVAQNLEEATRLYRCCSPDFIPLPLVALECCVSLRIASIRPFRFFSASGALFCLDSLCMIGSVHVCMVVCLSVCV